MKMKLYEIDNKHLRIISELNIGELNSSEEEKIAAILSFINEGQSRYNQYELASSADVLYEDGEPICIRYTNPVGAIKKF